MTPIDLIWRITSVVALALAFFMLVDAIFLKGIHRKILFCKIGALLMIIKIILEFLLRKKLIVPILSFVVLAILAFYYYLITRNKNFFE